MTIQESAYLNFLAERQEQDLQRELIPVEQSKAAELTVNGKSYINFSSNDYLGLSQHPFLIERAQAFAQSYGAGSGASRLVTGNLAPFAKIEAKTARLKNKPAALLMASGFQTNAAVLHALFDKSVLGEAPIVYADRLNHSSMHFGCAAAGVRQTRYRHLDMAHLEEFLERDKAREAPKFILTESVFSMDGDISPMDEICALARDYGCLVICDDAHATGILGQGGAGLSGDADIVIGTCSKALGSFGAFVACSQTLKDYLVNRCTGLIYSTGLPPAVLGAIDAALDLLPSLDKERAYVAGLSDSFRREVVKYGFETGDSQSQIVPVLVGDEDKALGLSDTLKEHGFWVTAIRPPTVAKGTARLRFAFCAHHTEDDVRKVINVLRS